MNYFRDCHTVAEIKKHYRELAMMHHPDRGGNTETMKAVNAQYHEALKSCDRKQETGSDGQPHVYYYDEKHEQEIIDKIAELLALRLEGTEVWLIGKWICIKGDTRPNQEALKKAGCTWDRKRLAWYWRP